MIKFTHSINSITRYLPCQSINIDGPHVKVAERFPEERQGDRIPIGHIPFGRIITNGSITEDVLFSLGEPAILPEPTLGTRRSRGHLEERPRRVSLILIADIVAYQIATLSIKTPSIRKSHRHPSRPATPRILRTPKAINGATISLYGSAMVSSCSGRTYTSRRVIQNRHNLKGNSSVLKK